MKELMRFEQIPVVGRIFALYQLYRECMWERESFNGWPRISFEEWLQDLEPCDIQNQMLWDDHLRLVAC